MDIKSFDDCCKSIALKQRLGTNLVTGHRRTYFEEAAILYATQMMENYFTKLIDSGYDILLEDNIPWPKDFTNKNKVDVLTRLLQYYNEAKDYVRCSMLQKQINLLRDKNSYEGKEN